MNASGTINDTFACVYNIKKELQRHGHELEYLCILSPSTDRTYEYAIKFSQDNLYSRVIECESQGVYSAMNIGLSEASGHFIHFLNSDDVVFDVQRYVASLLKMFTNGNKCMVSSIKYFSRPSYRCTSSWEINEYVCVNKFYNELMKGLHFPHPGFMASSSLYKKYGFDANFKYSADYKTMHQILIDASLNHSIYYEEVAFIAMDISGISGSLQGILTGSKELMNINHELNIKSNLIARYLVKLSRRLIYKLRKSSRIQIRIPSISSTSLK